MAFTEIKNEVSGGGSQKPIKQSGFVEVEVQRVLPEGSGDLPSYFDQIVANFDDRMDNQRKLTKSWKAGEMDSNTGLKLGPFSEEGSLDDMLGDFSYNAQSAMKTGSGTVIDVLGVAIGAAIDGVQLTMPVTTKAISDVVSAGWDFTMNTEGGQEAQEAFASGAEGYKKFKKENPNKASLFEGVVNTAIVFSPVRGFGKKLGPIEGSELATKYSNKLISSSLKSQTNEKNAILKKMLAPDATKKEILQGAEVKPITALNGATLELNTSQNQVLEYLTNLKGINPKKGPTHVNIGINKSQKLLNDEIGKILAQYKDVKIPIQSTQGKINYNIAQIMDGFPSLKSDKQIATTIKNYVAEANKILKNQKDSSPRGIHNARIEFDIFMKNEVNAGVLSAEATGLNSAIAKAIRNGMNSSIDGALPALNSVASRRISQNLNYRGLELIAPKVAKEGGKLSNFLQNVFRVNRTRATASSAAVLMGGGAFGSKVLGFTALSLGGVATIAGLTALAVKGTMSPTTRKALGVLLREGDLAIKNTVNSEMKKSLLTGKVLVADLLKNATVEKEQEQ
jgi:hypothetical protein